MCHQLDELKNHKETVLLWIRSCTRYVQIEMCKELIENLIVKKFTPFVLSGELDKLELESVRAELSQAINEKHLTIAASNFPEPQL